MLLLSESQAAGRDYSAKTSPHGSMSSPMPLWASAALRLWTGRKAPPPASPSSSAICPKSSNGKSTAIPFRRTCNSPSPSTAVSFRAKTWTCGRSRCTRARSPPATCAARLRPAARLVPGGDRPRRPDHAENDDAHGADSLLSASRRRPTASIGVRIRDANGRAALAYVYRLTLTIDPCVDRVYPLGGRARRNDAVSLCMGRACRLRRWKSKLPADGPRDFAWRPFPYGDGKAANPVQLDLDDLPEVHGRPSRTASSSPRRCPCRTAASINRATWIPGTSLAKKGKPFTGAAARQPGSRRCKAS